MGTSSDRRVWSILALSYDILCAFKEPLGTISVFLLLHFLRFHALAHVSTSGTDIWSNPARSAQRKMFVGSGFCLLLIQKHRLILPYEPSKS